MQLKFQIFPNYLFVQLQFFFLPELILHKYSEEGYTGTPTQPTLPTHQHTISIATASEGVDTDFCPVVMSR